MPTGPSRSRTSARHWISGSETPSTGDRTAPVYDPALGVVTKQNVSLHIKNILKDGELPDAATVTESLTVQNEGSRRVS